MRYCYGRNICAKNGQDPKAYMCCVDCNVKGCFWRCKDLDKGSKCKYQTTEEWVRDVGAKIHLGFIPNTPTKPQHAKNEIIEETPRTRVDTLTVSSVARKHGVPYQRIFHLHKNKGMTLEEIDRNLSKK